MLADVVDLKDWVNLKEGFIAATGATTWVRGALGPAGQGRYAAEAVRSLIGSALVLLLASPRSTSARRLGWVEWGPWLARTSEPATEDLFPKPAGSLWLLLKVLGAGMDG